MSKKHSTHNDAATVISNEPVESDIKALADMKSPFVLRDYQVYYEALNRDMANITTLRGWEIALISGLTIFFLNRQSTSLMMLLPLYTILGMLMLLECHFRAMLTLLYRDVAEKELTLSETDLKRFREGLINWRFNNQHRWTKKSIARCILRSMISPTVLLWHGSLAIALTIVFYKASKS